MENMEENTLLRGYVSKLRVTNPVVERYLHKNFNACIYTYNWCIKEYQRLFDELNQGKNWKDKNVEWVKPKLENISKNFTQFKKLPENKWLTEVDASALVYVVGIQGSFAKAVKDFWDILYNKSAKSDSKKRKQIYASLYALENKGKEVHFPTSCDYFPSFKFSTFSEKSYSTNGTLIKRIDNRITLPKLAQVVNKKKEFIQVPLCRPEYMPQDWNQQVTVSTDGVDYYVSMIAPFIPNVDNVELQGKIGIDVGLKVMATLSDGTVIENIAKSTKIKKIDKKIGRIQKRLSRKREVGEYIVNDYGKKVLVKTCSFKKLARRKRVLEIRRNDILDTEYKKAIAKIIQDNPEVVVVEDLNVEGMKKNKKLSSTIQKTGMSAFLLKLKVACEKAGIRYLKANRFYASSQICSSCGYKDESMKDLSKRTFICPHCGVTLDRDVNAARNLKNLVLEG